MTRALLGLAVVASVFVIEPSPAQEIPVAEPEAGICQLHWNGAVIDAALLTEDECRARFVP